MALEQVDVARIRAPGDIEEIANQRDGTKPGVDGDIRDHAPEDGTGYSSTRGREDYVAGQRRAEDVAASRNDADDRVETDPQGCSRYSNGGVQYPRQCTCAGQVSIVVYFGLPLPLPLPLHRHRIHDHVRSERVRR